MSTANVIMLGVACVAVCVALAVNKSTDAGSMRDQLESNAPTQTRRCGIDGCANSGHRLKMVSVNKHTGKTEVNYGWGCSSCAASLLGTHGIGPFIVTTTIDD